MKEDVTVFGEGMTNDRDGSSGMLACELAEFGLLALGVQDAIRPHADDRDAWVVSNHMRRVLYELSKRAHGQSPLLQTIILRVESTERYSSEGGWRRSRSFTCRKTGHEFNNMHAGSGASDPRGGGFGQLGTNGEDDLGV